MEMEPSKEALGKIKKFVSDTGEDAKVLKERWDKSEIQDENMRLIHCAILSDESVYRQYKTWYKWTEKLESCGINIYEFWAEIISKNQDKIKTELDAIRTVHEALAMRLRSSSKVFRGVILSVGIKRDNLSDFINQTLESYRGDPERAIKYGMVNVYNDANGVESDFPGTMERLSEKYFIDGNYVIPMGKKDVTIMNRAGIPIEKKDWFGGRYDGKPVVGCAFMQTVDVVSKTKEDDNYSWKEIILSDEVCDLEKPTNTMIEFEASVSPSNDTRLNVRSGSEFKDIGEFDYDTIVKSFSRRVLEFDDIPDYVNKTNNTPKRFSVKPVLIKVMDVFVSDDGATILAGSPRERTLDEMGTLFDDKMQLKDSSYYFKVSKGVKVNFPKGSIIWVFCNPTYGSKRVGDKWETDTTKFSAWVNGTLVPKDVQIKDTNVNVSQEEIDSTKWSDEKTEEKVEEPKAEKQKAEEPKVDTKAEEQKEETPKVNLNVEEESNGWVGV